MGSKRSKTDKNEMQIYRAGLSALLSFLLLSKMLCVQVVIIYRVYLTWPQLQKATFHST